MAVITTSGKRKTAIARAKAMPGNGTVRINKTPIDNIMPEMIREKIREPVILAGKAAEKIDIDVKVVGGGTMSQASAARLAIARAIVEYTKSAAIKDIFLKYDRQLLVADVRRKEMYKPNDSKARKKRQKSYR